jgi:hypothetical protein
MDVGIILVAVVGGGLVLLSLVWHFSRSNALLHQGRPMELRAIAAAAVGWAYLFLVLVLLVPRYEDTFRAQAVRLPAPTVWALAAGRWAEAYWYVLPLLGLLVILLSWLLRQRARGRRLRWLWFLVVLGIPVLLHLGLWWALHLP